MTVLQLLNVSDDQYFSLPFNSLQFVELSLVSLSGLLFYKSLHSALSDVYSWIRMILYTSFLVLSGPFCVFYLQISLLSLIYQCRFSRGQRVAYLYAITVQFYPFRPVYWYIASTPLSRYTTRRTFSAFQIMGAFTSSTSYRMALCCTLTAEISAFMKSSDFLISSPSSAVNQREAWLEFFEGAH